MKVRFKEMWSDVRTYMSNLYNEHGQVFTPASPFAQILQTILHVGRMVLYYVEDSITELNISTASRPHLYMVLQALRVTLHSEVQHQEVASDFYSKKYQLIQHRERFLFLT